MSVPAAYITVILVWSTTPLALKWSAEGVPVVDAVLLRMAIGGLLSYALIKTLRIELPWHRAAWANYGITCVSLYGGMITGYWAVQFMPSGLLSVIYGTSPMVVGLLSAWLLRENPLSPFRVLALLLSILGLALVFYDQLSLDRNGLWGLLLAMISVLCWSTCSVLLKKQALQIHPLAQTTGGLLLVSLLYGATHFLTLEEWSTEIPVRALVAISYLAVFGSLIGFLCYFYILQKLSVSTTTLVTLITPVLALWLGHALAGEALGRSSLVGTALVLTGLAGYQWQKPIIARLRRIYAA